MKKNIIEITIDENGDVFAETKGMEGKICAKELDSVLEGISGERKTTNTSDYYKTPKTKQTVKRG